MNLFIAAALPGSHSRTMKYLCLVYSEEKKLDDVRDSECVAHDAKLRQSGHCVASEALQPARTATTVRVRNGKVSIVDGPFAETKEVLAGFYLIEASDLEEAIELAARIPPARVGSIEVRPVRPIRETARADADAHHAQRR
ncbi:MAG: YciI family protein [Burkholderiaceae bacterium]